jgi:hypothetical protein
MENNLNKFSTFLKNSDYTETFLIIFTGMVSGV